MVVTRDLALSSNGLPSKIMTSGLDKMTKLKLGSSSHAGALHRYLVAYAEIMCGSLENPSILRN